MLLLDTFSRINYFWQKYHYMHTLADFTKQIEEELKAVQFHEHPEKLYEPVRYILDMGGKRLRPALTLLSASLFSEEYKKAIPAALAIEIFHNFTLLHDDIMDKADVRRGKPTVHKVWDENTAILSGDAAMILSYEQLSKIPAQLFTEVFKVFNNTALEVCEGQQYDMDFEKIDDVTIPEYLEMIRLKTSVLIAACMKIGAIISGASPEEQDAMYEIGENIGLAFQLQDDYLDCYSDTKKFGKESGGDIVNNKKTYLLISALNSGNNELVNELNNWISKKDFSKEDKIRAVKAIYDELGVGNDAQLASVGYINNAIEILNQIEVPAERKKPLEDIIFKLMYREK